MTVLTEITDSMIRDAKGINTQTLAARYFSDIRQGREHAGPCPKCGGTDRFHVTPTGWFCRQCHPDFSDNIDFLQWLNGWDWRRAVETLVGVLPSIPPKSMAQTQPQTVYKQVSDDWRQKAEEIARGAHDTLMIDGDGADYLESRGLTPDSWRQFKLGFKADVALPDTWHKQKAVHVYAKQPAIVIPWYRGGKLTAIRYRFLQTHKYTDAGGKLRVAKQSAVFDSDFSGVLYGGQALLGCAEDLRTLVLCEGELNAISIWQQCREWNWDVLSLGSESAHLTPAMVSYAQKFERVIIWMDRKEVVEKIMASIPGAYGVSSPRYGDLKRDANDMLQAGTLGAFLATARFNACETAEERQRLYWNLTDANNLPGGLDAESLKILNSMKRQKGAL